MTTKEFLLEKELNWTRIEEMQEELKRNQKTIDELIKRNNELYAKMQTIAHDMQKKAEAIDQEFT